MKPSLKSLLPATLLVTSSVSAFTYTEPLNINDWLQIRDASDTSNEWRISYGSGTRLKLRSEASGEAELALYIDNTSFEGPLGSLTGYRSDTSFYTEIGLKNEQDKWVIRNRTNLTTSPQSFRTEFFANGYIVGGFYGDLFGVGTDSPSAKIHGRNDFIGTSSTTTGYTGIFGVAATDSASTGNLTLTDTTGGGLKNRFTVFLNGSGTVTQASAVTAGIDVNNGSITDGASFHAETLYIATGKSMGTYSGVWVRGGAVNGTLTNNYGIRVDSLQAGTNRYGLYITADPTFLGGTLTVNGEVSGTGITTTTAANKLVKTNASGKIDAGLLNIPANVLTTNGNGSQLTGLTAAQVGLNNVDNTSDATKNSTTAVLTNKTMSGVSNTFTDIPQSAIILDTATLASLNKANSALQPGGDGSALTGITASTVGALSNSGGTVNGNITATAITVRTSIRVPASGNLSMGAFTADGGLGDPSVAQ